jgi:uncharacterized membrane protein (TIGR02234 family)
VSDVGEAGQRDGSPAGRASLVAAWVLGGAGAAVVLWAAGETWARGKAPSAAGSLLPVSVSGKAVTGLPDALALVALAALVAVFAVRGVGRVVLCGLLTLCGAGATGTAAAGAFATGSLNAAAAKASGLTGTTARDAAHTGWPWIAVLGGVLLFACGVLALLRSRAWPAMSARYERDGASRPRAARRTPDPEHPAELWKALDRGEDPTA